MGSRRPKLSIEQVEVIERQDCATCGKPASEARGGRHGCVTDADGNARSECVPCWNASVEEYQRQRKAELAARPDCEACGKRKQRYTLLPGTAAAVEVCGPCSKRAQWNLRQPMLFATGWASITRDRVIAAALATR